MTSAGPQRHRPRRRVAAPVATSTDVAGGSRPLRPRDRRAAGRPRHRCSSTSRSPRRSSSTGQPGQHPAERGGRRDHRVPGHAAPDRRPVRPVGRLRRRVRRHADGGRRPGPGHRRRDLPFAMNMTVPSAFVIAVVGDAAHRRHQRVLRHRHRDQRADHDAGHAGHLPRPDQGPRRRPDDPHRELRPSLGVQRDRRDPAPGLHLHRLRRRLLVVLRYTVYGRSLYAIGASPSAARLAGIRTKRVIFIAFLLSARASPSPA